MVPGPLELGGGLDLGNALSKRFAPVRFGINSPCSGRLFSGTHRCALDTAHHDQREENPIERSSRSPLISSCD
jgi:hypothetical protein